jgi:hypothetical protein
MSWTARVSEWEVTPAQQQFLLDNGFTREWFRCPCGSCDPEEVLARTFDSEEDSDDFLFDEEGNFRF